MFSGSLLIPISHHQYSDDSDFIPLSWHGFFFGSPLPTSSLLSYPTCLGIYLLAQFAGVVSNVPGGLGVFETVMLLLLSPFFASGRLIGSLLAFRGIYNFLPLVLTLGTLGAYELRRNLNARV